MPPVEVRPVEVDVTVPEVTVPEVAVPEVAMAKVAMAAEMHAAKPVAATTETAAEAAAAMTNFDSEIVGQIRRLGRSCRIDQRHGLCTLDRRRKHHQPRHGEEAKQSLHR
jgi:hypothetical protein